MVKKSGKSSIFEDNAKMQGGNKIPLPAKKEYGTGLPYKKAKVKGKK